MNNHRLLPLAACVALLLAACGGSAPPESAAAKDADAGAAPEPVSTLVSAVSSGKAGAAVDLKFDIAQRPRVGESLPVSIVVTTLAADISKLQVIFQSTDGIQVVDGLELNAPANPASGQSFSHTVTVLPQKDGVSYLSAVALVDGAAGSSSVARTFAIPIIVGDVVAAEAAIADAAEAGVAAGPDGERVVPLPADESGKR
jgi:hypothetical protein